VLLPFLANPLVANAQSSGAQFSSSSPLFNTEAVMAANRQQTQKMVTTSNFRSPPEYFYRLDTVDSLLEDSSQSDRFSDYKLFSYLRSVQDFVDLSYFDDFDEDGAAEKMFVYQVGRALSDAAKRSIFSDVYNSVEEGFSEVKRRTTVHVVESSSGSYGLEQGESESEPFMKFRLHLSARNGLEPRIHLPNGWILRFNPLDEETRFEYSMSF
jgi:hypothetical protein